MAENIVLATRNLNFLVVGRRITAFVSAGTIISIAPVQDFASFTPGLFGTSQTIMNDVEAYAITITIVQRSDDHAYLDGAVKLSRTNGAPLPIDMSYSGMNYASGNAVVTTAPTMDISPDGVNTVAYTFTGVFPIAKVGVYVAADALTEDQINAFVGLA